MTGMPTLVLFFLALTLSTTVSVENKQECSQNDFRSYTHCIRKRQATNWCTSDGCQICSGNACQITCKGFSCGLCPNGDCCDGKKCNACYNNFCCLTPSCNNCFRACRDACSNDINCQNMCLPQCQNLKHDIFVTPAKTQKPGKPEAVVYIDGRPYKGNITGGQIPSENNTATVTINGIDHPATILLPFPAVPEKSCQGPNNPTQPVQNCSANVQNQTQNYYNLPQGCCHVVHPQQCQPSPVYPYQHCSIRSHQECSNLCTSKFVHLAPQNHQQNRCHYVQSYPYIYCGQNSVQNCDSCYTCNGQYNPSHCVRQNTCSNVCRQNFLPPNSARIQTRGASPYLQQYKLTVYQQQPIYQHQQPMQVPQIPNTQFMGRPMVQYG